MPGLCRALSPLCCFAASGAVEGWVLSSDRPTPGNVFCPAFLVLSLVRQPLLPGQSKTQSSLFSGPTTTLCYFISQKKNNNALPGAFWGFVSSSTGEEKADKEGDAQGKGRKLEREREREILKYCFLKRCKKKKIVALFVW